MDAASFLKPSEAALGLDFGNSSSKMSLAYGSATGVTIQRVLFHGGQDHPDRSDHPTEFVAVAALDGHQLICGRQALSQDVTIPLKTILTYVAGIRRKRVTDRLPGGRVLLRIIKEGKVDATDMRNVLRRHFELLRAAALQQADTCRVAIRAVVVTHPNYLHAAERSTDFELYDNEMKALLRPIWGSSILFESVSEGQAAGLYITERFEDPFSAADREKRYSKIFRGLDANGLNLVVADIGTSTLNLQALSIYFDEHGEVAASVSNVPYMWKSGTQGGSGLSNESVRKVVESYISPLQRQGELQDGELASILLDFEEKKKRINYITNSTNIILRGSDPYRSFPLSAETIRDAFRLAFQDGLSLLRRELNRMLELSKDFTVLFCGGSFCNIGLYTEVQQIMAEFDARARAKGIRARSTFLRDEHFWSNTVASGAALSLLRLPAPTDVMKGSAVGVQTVIKARSGWRGLNEAGFLIGRDGHDREETSFVNVYIHRKKMDKIRFSLVCDPAYYQNDSAPLPPPRPIRIGEAKQVIGGPLATYDLAWTLPPRAVPFGWVQIRARWHGLDQRSDRRDANEPIILYVTCCQLNKDGEVTYNYKDKKWCLTLQTDPATKLLQVVGEKGWPMWCPRCANEMPEVASCPACKF